VRARILAVIITLAPVLTACMANSRSEIPAPGPTPAPQRREDVLVANVGGPTAIAFAGGGQVRRISFVTN
jgi:hypothetical protein